MQKLRFDNFVKRFALACLLEYSDPSILPKLRKRHSFPLSVSNARQSQGNNDECAFRGTCSPFHGPELNTFRFCPKLKINMKCEWLLYYNRNTVVFLSMWCTLEMSVMLIWKHAFIRLFLWTFCFFKHRGNIMQVINFDFFPQSILLVGICLPVN